VHFEEMELGFLTPVLSIYDFLLQGTQDCGWNKIPAEDVRIDLVKWMDVLRQTLPPVSEEDSA